MKKLLPNRLFTRLMGGGIALTLFSLLSAAPTQAQNPEALYLVGNLINEWHTPDSGDAFTLNPTSDGVYSGELVTEGTGTLEFKVFDAYNNSWDNNCYGVTSGDAVKLTNGQASNWTLVTNPNTGSNLKISNWGGKGTITIDWTNHTLSVLSNDAIDVIYLVGAPQQWSMDHGNMSLTNVGNKVYKGTFKIGAGQFAFRFFTELDGSWPASKSIGAEDISGDGDIDIAMTNDTYSGSAYPGRTKNWQILNWTPAIVEMTVDLTNNTVEFTKTMDLENVLYVVGDPCEGGWDTGINQSALRLYPTGTENEYSGTIEIPENTSGNYFRIYAVLGDWNNGSMGPEGDNVKANWNENNYTLSFSDNVASTDWGFKQNNWVVSGSYNGPLTITVNITNNNKQVAFSTKEEDVVEPPLPSQLRLVGVMNDWDTMNSDYLLPQVENQEGVYTATFSNFPTTNAAGDNAFNLKVVQGDTWGIDFGGESFMLYGNSPYIGDISTDISDNIICGNWQGGEVTISVNLNASPATITVTAPNQPVYPTAMFLTGNFNNWKLADENYQMETLQPGVYSFEGKFPALNGELNFKIVNDATDWESTDMVDYGGENFALYSDEPYVGKLIPAANSNIYCYNWAGGEITISIDIRNNANSITITGEDQPAEGEAPAAMYLTGNMNGWVLNNWAYTLTKNTDGEYEGIFELDSKYTYEGKSAAPEFKIFYDANWNDVYGAPKDGGALTFTTTGNTLSTDMVQGSEAANWSLNEWNGGSISITVDYENETVSFYGKTAGIETLGSDAITGEEVIFNLQGVRVDRNHLNKGIYIINGKKVMVK